MAALSSPPARTRVAERRSLSERERTVVRAIAEAMFSEDGEVDTTRLDEHVDEVDVHVTAVSRPLVFGLRVLLFVVRVAPILMFFRVRTLERLSVPERVTVLTRLERSRLASLSLAFVGWRTVMTLLFYEHPSELQALGYTSNERTRYKRGLPVLAAVASPDPAESGVRLRNPDSEAEIAAGAANDADESGATRIAANDADESGASRVA